MPYAVMMRCNDGTTSIAGTGSSAHWVKNQHVITVTVWDTLAEAQAEVERLRPKGFDRENSQLWIEVR